MRAELFTLHLHTPPLLWRSENHSYMVAICIPTKGRGQNYRSTNDGPPNECISCLHSQNPISIWKAYKANLKYLQHNRHDSQKFSVSSELVAIVYLLPPSKRIVDTLIICKWRSLLPVKKVISNLKQNVKTMRKK